MLSSFSLKHQLHYQGDYYPLPKKKLKKLGNLSKSISDKTLSAPHGALMQLTSSLSKRKMISSDQCKITGLSINEPNETEMYHL
jgi:hypothetical protein